MRKVKRVIGCLFFGMTLAVMGCGVEPITETCKTNDDCVIGNLCYQEGACQ
jgi:hypothetical protein